MPRFRLHLRHWGWCLLVLLASSLLHAQVPGAGQPVPSLHFGHRTGVLTVDFSPDGTLLATGGEDWQVKVWRSRTGELVQTFKVQHNSQVRAAFTPDGKRVAASDGDSLIFWDVQTGKQVNVITHPQRLISQFAFSSDGALIAWASIKGEIDIVDAKTGAVRQTLTGPDTYYHRLLFTRDGTRLIGGGQDFTVKVWDLQTGKLLYTFFGYQGITNALGLSADGSTLLTCDSHGQMLTQDLATGKRIGAPLELKRGGYAMAISPDGKIIARGDADSTYLYDTKTGNLLNTLPHAAYQCLAFSPDGKLLASGSMDNSGMADVTLLDLAAGNPLWSANGLRAALEHLRFTPDGKALLAWGNTIPCYRWDMTTGRLQRATVTPQFTFNTCGMSADGSVLTGAQYRKGVFVLNGATGAQQRIITNPAGNFSLTAVSPNGASIAGVTGDYQTRESMLAMYDAGSGEKRWQVDGIGRLSRLAFWPDGKYLAAGTADRIIRIFNAQTGELRNSQQIVNPVSALAVSPSGALFAAGEFGYLEVWSFPEGRLIMQQQLKQDNGFGVINAIAFSPDNTQLVVGSQQGDVQLLDVNNKTWRPLIRHEEVVLAVAFSPDGKRIASASGDGNIKISDATGRLIANLYLLPADGKEPGWLALTPDGYFDGSASVKNYLSWRVDEKAISFTTGEKQFHRPDLLQKAFGE